MLIAKKDITIDGGRVIERGSVVPAGLFAQPEIQVRAGLLWDLPEEALSFAAAYLATNATKPEQSGGKRK
jgi:hypothetical protein